MKKCVKRDQSGFNGVVVKVCWMDDNKSVRFDFFNCERLVLCKMFAMAKNKRTQIEMEYTKT
jgi:hypothetical protein